METTKSKSQICDSDKQLLQFCGLIFLQSLGYFGRFFLHLSILQAAGMELIPLNKPLLSQLESTGQKAERHLKALAQIHVLLHCNTYDYYHRGHKMGLVSRLSFRKQLLPAEEFGPSCA